MGDTSICLRFGLIIAAQVDLRNRVVAKIDLPQPILLLAGPQRHRLVPEGLAHPHDPVAERDLARRIDFAHLIALGQDFRKGAR
ncbi:MAG: hypothetical protein GX491_19405 [Chloroflexi bacterium]|nr:hypothetical protein [Chloroflexota bacterium]